MPTYEIETTQEYLSNRLSRRVEKYRLDEAGLQIDMNRAIASADDAHQALGIESPIVAGIRAGKSKRDAIQDDASTEFLIADTREGLGTAPFTLLTLEGATYPVIPGSGVTVGRSSSVAAQSDSPYVSRRHFSVDLSEDGKQLRVRDLGSRNGTYLTGYAFDDELKDAPDIWAEASVNFMDDEQDDQHFRKADQFAPYGYLEGHPIIGRRSQTVRSGVYGSRASEIIVVDEQNEAINTVRRRVLKELADPSLTTYDKLSTVKSEVASVLRYDLARVAAERGKDGKRGSRFMPLSEYVRLGVGVCRHQALLAGLLMEDAVDRGLLKGSVHVERNQDLALEEAHAWAVFKPANGEDVIVDAAQDFVGTRGTARVEGRWKYYTDVASQ